MENQKNQKEPKKNKLPGLEKYAKYSGMAFEMIAIILVAAWGGLKLDEKFHEGEPLFVVILSILGVFAGLYIALKDFINPKK